MTGKRRILALVAAVVTSGSVGCGIYGGTSQFVIKPEKTIETSELRYRVEGGTVGIGPHANRVYAAGVNNLGGFRPGDRQVLESSLRNSLRKIEWPEETDTWKVHVLVRSYVAAYNNSSGALLASVAWCVMDAAGALVYQEQFYASTTEGMTLGGAKDVLNKAIARRVVKAVLVLASSESIPDRLPIGGDYICTSIEEAAQPLPRSMLSSLPIDPGAHAIDWTSFDPQDDIDWAQVVATW